MYIFYYLPYFYTYRAKLKERGRLLSYFLIFILPPAYFALILPDSINLLNILSIVLGLFITQNLYEVGYIQNDTETIKKEKNPTFRLNSKDLDYYALNRFKIYIVRFLFDLFLCALLFIISENAGNVLLFVGIVHLIIPLFVLYNSIRNYWNLLLQFILSILKFASVQFLFFENLTIINLILSVAIFPVMHLIDRIATPRFTPRFSEYYIPRTSKFRAGYYFLFCAICIALFFYGLIDIKQLIIAVYFFIYRSMIVLFNFK